MKKDKFKLKALKTHLRTRGIEELEYIIVNEEHFGSSKEVYCRFKYQGYTFYDACSFNPMAYKGHEDLLYHFKESIDSFPDNFDYVHELNMRFSSC